MGECLDSVVILVGAYSMTGAGGLALPWTMEDPGLATEEEECPLATSPLATSLQGHVNRSNVDSRPTRSGGGGPRRSSDGEE